MIERLRKRIRDIEHKEHCPASAPFENTGLQKILPKLRSGTLVELLSTGPGAGAWTLALLLAKQACGERKALVIVDSQNAFYPPAACKLGIDLDRTIVIRAVRGLAPHAQAAVVQSLRCAAVGAVMSWFDRLSSLDFRRLQLSAEAGGGLGLLLRPASALRAPSFAAARLLVTPAPSGKEEVRRMHIEAVRMRGKTGQSVTVEVHDETGDVHLSAQLASAKTRARASG